MPYITPDRREEIDEAIETLQRRLKGEPAGTLNYAISRLIGAKWHESPSYATGALLSGVLDNVKLEFYRRVLGRYENNAIRRNGDIKEYIR